MIKRQDIVEIPKMHYLFLLSVTLLTKTAYSQIERAPICTETDTKFGLNVKPHRTFCSLYYQCLSDLSAVVMVCPEGLLFDEVSRVCERPALATCLNKQCPQDRSDRSWPHICCDRYIGCQDGKYYYGRCSDGMVYNSQQGRCVRASTCQAHPKCSRLQPHHSTPKPICRRRTVANEPCKFREFSLNGRDLGIQNCAMGTAFTQTTCNCGKLFNCTSAMGTAIGNRVFDPKCRATMVLDFSGQVLTSYTLKTTNGQRMTNNYAIGTYGYKQENSEGILFPLANGEKARLYFWPFVRNMLLGPFGVKISFRADNPREGYSFMVIGNEMSALRPDCQGTLDIRATYRNRQWEIAVKAVGYSWVKGKLVSAQAAQTVRGANGYITISFIFSRATRSISGYVSDQGSSSVPWGPVKLEAYNIDSNNCGIAVAHGLEGRLREVEFYESCGDEDILRSKLQ